MSKREYLDRLYACMNNGDTEIAHADADNIICDVAISAAEGKLTLTDVAELVILYRRVDKWYA